MDERRRRDRARGLYVRRNRKLTIEQVREIRRKIRRREELRSELKSLTNEALAKEYGVSAGAIWSCQIGETFKYQLREGD